MSRWHETHLRAQLPVDSGTDLIRSLFGKHVLEGVPLEALGGVRLWKPDGGWGGPGRADAIAAFLRGRERRGGVISIVQNSVNTDFQVC